MINFDVVKEAESYMREKFPTGDLLTKTYTKVIKSEKYTHLIKTFPNHGTIEGTRWKQRVSGTQV